MYSLHGDDIGTTLPFSFGHEPFDAQHPWPEDTTVSAGGSSRRGSYFLEAYPPTGGYLRGDGATPAEAEDRCWANYQKLLNCPAAPDGAHQWAPGTYRNGVGICTGCGSRQSGVFTPEDLGQFCHTCGVGTLQPHDEAGIILCPEHQAPEHACEVHIMMFREMVREQERRGPSGRRSTAMLRAMADVEDGWDWMDDDPEADGSSSKAPTVDAQEGLLHVLGADLSLISNAIPVPRRAGGIRLLVRHDRRTVRRIDVDADGTTFDLAYDTDARVWTRTPIELTEEGDF